MALVKHKVLGLVVIVTEGGVLVLLQPYLHVRAGRAGVCGLCSTGRDTWARPPVSNGGLARAVGLTGASGRNASVLGPRPP